MSGGPHYIGKSLVIRIVVHHYGTVHQMLCTKMEIFQLTPRRKCVFDMHDELSKFYINFALHTGMDIIYQLFSLGVRICQGMLNDRHNCHHHFVSSVIAYSMC